MSTLSRSIAALLLSLSLSAFGAGCADESSLEDELEELDEAELDEEALDDEALGEGELGEAARLLNVAELSEQLDEAIERDLAGRPTPAAENLRGRRACYRTPDMNGAIPATRKPRVSEREIEHRGPFPRTGALSAEERAALEATAPEASELLEQVFEYTGDAVPQLRPLTDDPCDEAAIVAGDERCVPCEIES